MLQIKQIQSTFNHADVVGPVPDGERDRLLVLLDEVDDESLLQRSDATTNDGLAHASDLQQQQLQLGLQCVHLDDVSQNLYITSLFSISVHSSTN